MMKNGEKWVVVVGTSFDDMAILGPFDNKNAAYEFGEYHYGPIDEPDVDWGAYKLHSVIQLQEKE